MPMSRTSRISSSIKTAGFTLMELMIVVVVIGIISAIAIPSYQTYLVRTKIHEVILTAELCRVNATEWFQNHAYAWPTNAQMGCLPQATKYATATAIDTATGKITVTTATAALGLTAANNTYVLTPYAPVAAIKGTFSWGCTNSTLPTKYLPKSCNAAGAS